MPDDAVQQALDALLALVGDLAPATAGQLREAARLAGGDVGAAAGDDVTRLLVVARHVIGVAIARLGMPEEAADEVRRRLNLRQPTVFLSYSWGDDKAFAERLEADLTKAGILVWRDETRLPSGGAPLREELRNAIDTAARVLPIVGPKALASQNVRLEWNYARTMCRAIVPVLRLGDETLMPADWRDTCAPLYFDFRDDAAYTEKLEGLIRCLKEPPEFPGWFKGDAILQPPQGAIERKEMAALVDLLRPDRTTAAITGRAGVGLVVAPGGVGKSVLASMFAVDCATRRAFPDGIVWIELGQRPVIPEKQGQIGEVFGDDKLAYKDETTGKARLQYLLAEKRALIVLDDVWDYRHAAAFLVEAPRCRWLITTRHTHLPWRLNLTPASVVALDYLSEDEGAALIAGRLGLPPGEAAPHAETHRAIVHLLGGHTQAVALAAMSLCDHGADYAPRLLERLRAREGGDSPFADLILEVEDKEKNLELALSLSYDDLAPDLARPRTTDGLDLQRRFRALGVLAPGSTFDLAMAMAVWGDEAEMAAEDALAALVNAGLLVRTVEGRYGQHGLLRAYALALLRREGEYEGRFVCYAEQVIEVTEQFDELPLEEWHTFEAELPHVDYVGDTLVARYSASPDNVGWQRLGTQLAGNVTRYVHFRPQLVEAESGPVLRGMNWLEMGCSLAEQAGDEGSEARFLNHIGGVWDALGEKHKALDHYERALLLSHTVGDHRGEAVVFNNIGLVRSALGEKRKALTYYEQALPLSRAVKDREGEAVALNNIGLAWNDLGEKHRALYYYDQALLLRRAMRDRGGEATTLNNIASVWSALGEQRKALGYYERALHLVRAVGDRVHEAGALSNIAFVWDSLGERHKALSCYGQSLPLSRAAGDRAGEATALNNIGCVWSALGNKRKALDYYERALPLRRVVGDRWGEAATLNNLGTVWSELGEQCRAFDYYKQVLDLVHAMGDREGEATARHNLGMLRRSLGDLNEAIEHFERCVALDIELERPDLERDRSLLQELRQERDLKTLVEFVDTPDWQTACEYLGAHPNLLDPETDATFAMLIEAFGDGPEYVKVIDHFEMHRVVLRMCRKVGVDAVFAKLLS